MPCSNRSCWHASPSLSSAAGAWVAWIVVEYPKNIRRDVPESPTVAVVTAEDRARIVPVQQRRTLCGLPLDARLDQVCGAGRRRHGGQGRRGVHTRDDGCAGRVLRPQHHAHGTRRLERRGDRARDHDRGQQARRGVVPGDAVPQLRRARPGRRGGAGGVHPHAEAAARRSPRSFISLPDADRRAHAAAAAALRTPSRSVRSASPTAAIWSAPPDAPNVTRRATQGRV